VLPDVNGILDLTISAPHFDDARMSVDTAASSGLTVRLLPTDRIVTDVGERLGGPAVKQGTLAFDMHRGGRVDFYADGQANYGDGACLVTDIRANDNTLVWSQTWWNEYGNGSKPVALSLDGGKRYVVTLTECRSSTLLLTYRMTATHPY
jgi:hypothetical protein